MDDGNNARAAEVVMAAVAAALLPKAAPLQPAQAILLAELAAPTLRNWNGSEVGGLRGAEALQQALTVAA